MERTGAELQDSWEIGGSFTSLMNSEQFAASQAAATISSVAAGSPFAPMPSDKHTAAQPLRPVETIGTGNKTTGTGNNVFSHGGHVVVLWGSGLSQVMFSRSEAENRTFSWATTPVCARRWCRSYLPAEPSQSL